MPLVILCGYPSSGKTTLAHHLKSFLDTKLLEGALGNCKAVHIVNEEFLKVPTNDYFMSKPQRRKRTRRQYFILYFLLFRLDVNEEKKVRAALLAASERFVSKDTIVILDSLNYIKGFRYQLYCQARAASTPHLVIHCQARESTCRLWNQSKERVYPSEQLEDLILRFEAPNNQNKWDSPLFGVATEVVTESELIDFFESLVPVLCSTPNRPPSTATLTNKPTSSNSIQILDSETQTIIDTVLAHQQNQLPLVRFPGTSKTLALPRPVTLATLSRVRRQFLHLNRLHPTTDPEKIRSLFIDFLASNMYL